jgi:hypothetical protein
VVFLLEEAVVEGAAIIATIVAASILILVLAGFALEYRAARSLASRSSFASRGVRPERAAPARQALAHRG